MTTQAEYEAQIARITAIIKRGVEIRIEGGATPDAAFEQLVNYAAGIPGRDEATIQMMTLAAGDLARGWEHSAEFVKWWNATFPDANRVQGFACPATINLPNGQRAAIAAPWSVYMSTWAHGATS